MFTNFWQDWEKKNPYKKEGAAAAVKRNTWVESMTHVQLIKEGGNTPCPLYNAT